MGKKKYEKPEIKDFVSPFLHGDISPMGFCENGMEAGGSGACETGYDVWENLEDCADGSGPDGYCDSGSRVSRCYGGTYA